MKTRLISGAVGIIIFVAAIFAALKIDALILHVLLAAVGCIGVYEAIKPTGYVKSKFLIITSIVYAAVAPFIYSIDLLQDKLKFDFAVKHEAWVVLYCLIIFTVAMLKHKSITPVQVTYAFCTTFAITFAFWSLAALFSDEDGHGLFYMIIVFIAAWACDTGAYFVGYFFGKHKMAPEISPKKTVEGAVGGIVTDMLIMLVACIIFNKVTDYSANTLLLVGVTPVLAFAGMMGDLIFSYIKRDCGIKDYGKIMPGHGGILDRFDSVIAVAPLMYIIVSHLPLVK